MEKLEKIIAKAAFLELYKLTQTIVNDMDDFDRTAFAGYYLRGAKSFSVEFINSEYGQKLKKLFSEGEKLFGKSKKPSHSLGDKSQEYSEILFNILGAVLLSRQDMLIEARNKSETLFQKDALRIQKNLATRTKTIGKLRKLLGLLKELGDGGEVESFRGALEKSYDEDPFFQNEENRKYLPKEEQVFLFLELIKLMLKK